MNVFSRSLSPASATVVVLTAMVGYGFNPLFARWIYAFGLSPEISVVYRYDFLHCSCSLLSLQSGTNRENR